MRSQTLAEGDFFKKKLFLSQILKDLIKTILFPMSLNLCCLTCVVFLVGREPTLETPEDDITLVEDPDNVTTTIGTRVTVLESSNVKLRCHADGYPTPTVAWLLNGKPLVPDGNISVDDDSRSLAIKNVKPNVGGEYSCIASNSLGSDSLITTLNVIGKFPDDALFVLEQKECE